jgi:RNA polymerase sigma-70 factor (ECF subfamily)
MEDEEALLVAQSREGSSEAFSRLVILHQAPVRGYLARFVRDIYAVGDLAQDTFVNAFRGLGSYKGDVPFRHWLLGVARRRALLYLRQKMRRQAHAGRLVTEVTAWMMRDLEDDEAQMAERARQLEALGKCLATLPGESAQVLTERYADRRSAVEIGQRIGKSEGAVRILLFRIRRDLRICIERRIAQESA